MPRFGPYSGRSEVFAPPLYPPALDLPSQGRVQTLLL